MEFPKYVQVIFDRRLYSKNILFSLFVLATAAIVNAMILSMFSFQLSIIYLMLFIFLIIVSALPAKNVGRNFYAIEFWLSALFLITSVIAEAFTFLISLKGLIGFFEYILCWCVSNGAVVVSTLHVTVSSQRAALRESAGLVDNFFAKQKKAWKDELKEVPNAKKIIECLEDGKFIPQLFDKGFFNLTVLWSCNVMEKIIDAATEEIIARKPEKRSLFFKDAEKRLPYPKRLKNLGYEYSAEDRLFGVEVLWNKIRNKIAHHNQKPTFDETYETLKILVSFMHAMPTVLKMWLT